MVSVVVFEFGVMRCQPLRRALCPFTVDVIESRKVNYEYPKKSSLCPSALFEGMAIFRREDL
ncbi:hypothetical protein FXE34_10955 [Vibrio cholerae]|nr:hypothetical protein FXF14_02525 [Vibrio cholerae]TYA07737.1 hypothetical protein FXE34_10955 [Vibrio cholerae]